MGCKTQGGDFPGSPVVKASPSNEGGVDLIPGQGAKIPHILWPKHQNIKETAYPGNQAAGTGKVIRHTVPGESVLTKHLVA